MTQKPTILQVLPALSNGGAEQGCIDVAAAVKDAGGRAIIISNGGPREVDALRAGAEHIKLPVHSKNPITIIKNRRRIKKIIEREDVSLVHVRSRAPAWSAWKAAKKAHVPFVTTFHAPYNFKSSTKRYYNSIMARGERVIAISEWVADYVRKNYHVDQRRLRIIPRGITLERFHPTSINAERLIQVTKDWRVPDGAQVILMPGRITRWKGQSVVIEAMRLLNRDDLYCVFLGDDQGRKAYVQELEGQISAAKLEGRVRILAHCKDMPAAYMMAACVLSASTEPEGFGRISVEGQAMGRPVIATDHGGSRETIKRNETGWLIPPNDPQALAQAIEETLSLKPEQRAVLATHAMAHIADNFTRDLMCERTLAVYNELLGAKGF